MKIKKEVFIISFIGTGIALLFLMFLLGFSNIREGEKFLFVTLWIILSLGIAAAAIYEEERKKDLNKKVQTSEKRENIFAISLIIALIPTCISMLVILNYFNVEVGAGLGAKGIIAIVFFPLFILYGAVFYPVVGKIYNKFKSV